MQIVSLELLYADAIHIQEGENQQTSITNIIKCFFQHYLTLLSSNLATPGIIASTICAIGIPNETHVKSELMGNMIFACGVCTLVQSFIGTR